MTAVHPESYRVVEKIAASLGVYGQRADRP